MKTTIPKTVRIWGAGQLTIPKEIRMALKLDNQDQMNIFMVGHCVMMTPKKLERPSLARKAGQDMKIKGLTLEDVLKDLRKFRKQYMKETYGG